MNKKPAQAGIVHVALIIGLVILGAIGFYLSKNPPNFLMGTKAASNKPSFSNLSSDLRSDKATFNFTYSGSSPSYKVDISTSSNMKQNLYRNFGEGSSSPIVVSSPQSRYPSYQCGTTLYWIIKATDERSVNEIKSSVQTTRVDCSTGIGTTAPQPTPVPTSTATPTPTPTPTSTPTSSCTPQTKPATVTLQGSDGTWCYDSDGNGNYTNAGYCQDSCSSTNDYCQADGTNRDGYCTGSWNGSSWSSVHCDFGGYACSSFGKICSAGACI